MFVKMVLLVFVACLILTNEVTSINSPLRIVNGTEASEGEFPYVVQLRDLGDSYFCGGSIIGSRWILTAGHCLQFHNIKTAVYGTNLLYDRISPETVVNVTNLYIHPNFTHYTIDPDVGSIVLYDVGIVELEEDIVFDENTQPIQLVETNEVPFHVDGVLTGWGFNETYGSDQINLQKITLQLLTDQECEQRIFDYTGLEYFNSTHNLCSDDYWNGECYGDSGSPFVINGVQYGIVSWSFKPCGSNPGTYSRIGNPNYRDFIRNVTGI